MFWKRLGSEVYMAIRDLLRCSNTYSDSRICERIYVRFQDLLMYWNPCVIPRSVKESMCDSKIYWDVGFHLRILVLFEWWRLMWKMPNETSTSDMAKDRVGCVIWGFANPRQDILTPYLEYAYRCCARTGSWIYLVPCGALRCFRALASHVYLMVYFI